MIACIFCIIFRCIYSPGHRVLKFGQPAPIEICNVSTLYQYFSVHLIWFPSIQRCVLILLRLMTGIKCVASVYAKSASKFDGHNLGVVQHQAINWYHNILIGGIRFGLCVPRLTYTSWLTNLWMSDSRYYRCGWTATWKLYIPADVHRFFAKRIS